MYFRHEDILCIFQIPWHPCSIIFRLNSSVPRTMSSSRIFGAISYRPVSSERSRKSSRFVLSSSDGRRTIFWGRFHSIEPRLVRPKTLDDRRDGMMPTLVLIHVSRSPGMFFTWLCSFLLWQLAFQIGLRYRLLEDRHVSINYIDKY